MWSYHIIFYIIFPHTAFFHCPVRAEWDLYVDIAFIGETKHLERNNVPFIDSYICNICDTFTSWSQDQHGNCFLLLSDFSKKNSMLWWIFLIELTCIRRSFAHRFGSSVASVVAFIVAVQGFGDVLVFASFRWTKSQQETDNPESLVKTALEG